MGHRRLVGRQIVAGTDGRAVGRLHDPAHLAHVVATGNQTVLLQRRLLVQIYHVVRLVGHRVALLFAHEHPGTFGIVGGIVVAGQLLVLAVPVIAVGIGAGQRVVLVSDAIGAVLLLVAVLELADVGARHAHVHEHAQLLLKRLLRGHLGRLGAAGSGHVLMALVCLHFLVGHLRIGRRVGEVGGMGDVEQRRRIHSGDVVGQVGVDSLLLEIHVLAFAGHQLHREQLVVVHRDGHRAAHAVAFRLHLGDNAHTGLVLVGTVVVIQNHVVRDIDVLLVLRQVQARRAGCTALSGIAQVENLLLGVEGDLLAVNVAVLKFDRALASVGALKRDDELAVGVLHHVHDGTGTHSAASRAGIAVEEGFEGGVFAVRIGHVLTA